MSKGYTRNSIGILKPGVMLLLKKFTRKRQKKALRYSIGKLKSYICLHAHFGLNA